MKTSLIAYIIKFRRGIAAVCASLAVLMVISALTGGKSDHTVAVASHALAAGTQIAADDLTEATLPARTVWSGLFSTPGALVGRTTSHAIAAGQPLGRSDIVSTDLLRGMRAGTVAVEIAPSQISNTSMLQAGHRIDLYATDRDGDRTATLIAHDVVVLAQGGREAQGTNISGLSTSTQATAVMVGLSPADARKLAASMNTYQLVAVLLN
jgi:Flp pilus assembly protein CpaB